VLENYGRDSKRREHTKCAEEKLSGGEFFADECVSDRDSELSESLLLRQKEKVA